MIMKNLFFVSALSTALFGSTVAQSTLQEELELRIIDDLTSFVHDYDFKEMMQAAVSEEGKRQAEWKANYNPGVKEILSQLQDQLKDKSTIE